MTKTKKAHNYKQPTKKMVEKQKAHVYIDAANMFYSQKTIGFEVDYKKFFKFLFEKYNAKKINYYTGYNPENIKQLKFLAKLETFGYRVIRKPIKIIKTKKKIIEKANVDVELTIDAMQEKNQYDTVVLASGDIVISARGHISKELINLTDYYLPLEKIKKEIRRTKKSPRQRRGKLS